MESLSSSSDEDEEHKAALRSVAIDSNAVMNLAAPKRKSTSASKRKSKDGKNHEDVDSDSGDNASGLKFYQTRVQDLLYKHLDKVFEDTEVTVLVREGNRSVEGSKLEGNYDGETRLFSDALPGVHLKRSRLNKNEKKRVLPHRYENSDEDTTEKDARLKTAAVEGSSIKAQAKVAAVKARGRFLAAVADVERTEKEEGERVKRMRELRGEEWLPSVAKEMVSRVKAERGDSKVTNQGTLTGTVVEYRT